MFLARRMKVRNGIYHYRRRVPSDLRDSFSGLIEFTKSLHTGNASEARALKEHYDRELTKIFLAHRVHAIEPDTARELIDRLLFAKKFTPRKSLPISQIAPSIPSLKTISEVFEEFKSEKNINWTEKTQGEFKGIYSRIVDYFGNTPVARLTRQDFVGYRDHLRKTRKDKTVNKYISCLASLMTYADGLDYVQKNFCRGLSIKINTDESKDKEAYSAEELQTLIDLLSANRTKWEAAGHHEYFWVPMIAILSGMRVDEICQLYVEDVGQIYDPDDKKYYYYFDINDQKDKKLKNPSSARFVSIHSCLIEQGFLSYYRQLREENYDRIFPRLARLQNGYSHKFVQWFSKFNRKYITENKKKTFHSLRANVTTALTNAQANPILMKKLIGHKNNDITFDRYTKEIKIIVLYQLIDKLPIHLGVDIREPIKKDSALEDAFNEIKEFFENAERRSQIQIVKKAV